MHDGQQNAAAPVEGGWVHVRYESVKRSSAARRASRTTASAAADASPAGNAEEDDDERHHDSGNEDPEGADDVDVIGSSDVAAGGNATHAAASDCRLDVYSGFMLMFWPEGRTYLLP